MLDTKEKYLKSIDHTLKAILAELGKEEHKTTQREHSKRPVTKEEVLQQSIKGKPPDRKHKAYK